MPCLIAFIKADRLSDGIQFIDYISGLQGNPIIKSKKKHLILMTSTFEQNLLQNRTGNDNLHIISEGEKGMVTTMPIYVMSE